MSSASQLRSWRYPVALAFSKANFQWSRAASNAVRGRLRLGPGRRARRPQAETWPLCRLLASQERQVAAIDAGARWRTRAGTALRPPPNRKFYGPVRLLLKNVV